MAILSAFEPIWLFAGLGYAARRWRLLSEKAVTVLGWFVFHLAMPAALFVRLTKTPLAGFNARPLGAFAASTVLVIGLGWYAAGRFFDRKPGERAIWGMSGGYVNAANLGIPVAMQVLGSISFEVQVLLFQTLVVSPVILITLDRHAEAAGRHADAAGRHTEAAARHSEAAARRAEAAGRVRLWRTATVPFRNPIIVASALGITSSAVGFHPPSALLTPLTVLSMAALPAALIALGASLYRGEPALDVRTTEVSAITALKLVVQPAVACAIGLLLHLPPALLLAVVVCAGLPTAQNSFVFAQRYGVGDAIAGRAVLVTTTLSLATIAAIATLFGH
jgi:malonate transporter and related proteins